MELAGFHAALPTPFTADAAQIAERPLGELVRRNIDAGLTGLYVGGSTGEAFLMTPQERSRALSVTAAAAAGECTLIAHVGDTNPSVSVWLAREAAELGYHAISAVPPFYYRYTTAEIRAHYVALSSATDLPFLVYNFPALTGLTLTADEIADLLTLPNVVGVKNTSPDYYMMEQLRRRAPEAIILNGFDETLLAGLTIGADGGIGSTYNVHPHKVLSLAGAVGSGDIAKARQLQGDINRLIDAMVRHGVFAALKFLLDLSGLAMGPCRPPFQPLSPEAKADLEHHAEVAFASHTPPKAAVGG